MYSPVRRRPKSTALSVPPPIGGLNTRDALSAMPQTDAISLDNWFPTVGEVKIRNGYELHQTPGGTNVDFMMEYHAGANRQLIAASNSNLWNASSTPSSIGSGFSSDQWEAVNFNGKMLLCNGTDNEKTWDGSSLTNTSWTGITAGDLVGYHVFKNRVFAWKANSQDFYYGQLNAVTGPLTNFPLSRVALRGGNLVGIGSITHDGGSGVDDYIAFFMTSGEVLVYKGTDPGSASSWALVGIYDIAPAVTKRGIISVSGDVTVITRDDYVSLMQVIKTGGVGNASKLSGAVRDLQGEMANFGWQATLYKAGNMLIFNHPDGSKYRQHVVNTLTGAATRFTDIEARSWAVYNNSLYFGSTDGKIYKADTGSDDNGAAIIADGQQAWFDAGSPQPKALKAIRVPLRGQTQLSYGVKVGFDYDNPTQPTTTLAGAPSSSLWDVALWDVALWGGGTFMNNSWKIQGGRGQAISPRVRVQAKQNVSWLRTDYRMEMGINL